MKTVQIKRPGGRSAQVQAVVRTALEELVAEHGRERVTVPAVAERAGVSASSIYRRWGDLQGLLAETATHRLDPDRPLPDTGDLKKDLTAWARELIVHLTQPCNTSLLKAAAALVNGEDTNCLRNRKREAQSLVERATARGEPAPTTQQAIDHLIAPIVFRLVFGAEAVPPALATRLVEELYAMVPARASAPA
ncbi:MAG: TetR/AcrR family transcriptional regulator [Pseudomonadota bacterium]